MMEAFRTKDLPGCLKAFNHAIGEWQMLLRAWEANHK